MALVGHRRVDAHLRSQMSKAARGIPSTLVEGCGTESQAELARFCDMASPSCSELEYWVLTARDLGYFSEPDFNRLTANTIEVRKMLFGFRNAVRGAAKEAKLPRDSTTEISPRSYDRELRTRFGVVRV